MKKFELHPPVKKVGMKRIFLFHGIKRRFFFVPRNKKNFFIPTFFTGGCSSNLFALNKVKFAAEMKETLHGNGKRVFSKKCYFMHFMDL